MKAETLALTASLGLAAAAAVVAAPAVGGEDGGVAPPATVGCPAFVALGEAAKAGGATWTGAAVWRLFYDAYAMGLIDGARPGTTLSVHEGALAMMPVDQRFQAMLRSADGNLDGFCRENPDKTLDRMMRALAALALDAAEQKR